MFKRFQIPSDKMRDFRQGFTLVEVMIVVAIIGIIAALAIPNFIKFRSRAMQAEAKENLSAIHTCQMVYFSDYDQFAGGEQAFELIKFIPIAGKNRYTYILDQSIIPGTVPINSPPAGIPSSRTGFTAIAVSNIDNDPFLDFWAINDRRDLRNQQVDINGWGASGSDIRN